MKYKHREEEKEGYNLNTKSENYFQINLYCISY